MSDRLDQFYRPVHRQNLAFARRHTAGAAAIGTGLLVGLLGSHIAGPTRLNQPAQTLADLMRGNLDLIIMGRPSTLLQGLQLSGHRRSLLQQIGQPLFQL